MKLALNKPKKTPSKIPKNMRPRYFFKYGQQNEYNLEICDTIIFATSRTAQHSNENNLNHQPKYVEIQILGWTKILKNSFKTK